MTWKKNSPEMVALMDDAISSVMCLRKQMFGGVAYFINGNMFAGLNQDMPFIRLSERDRQQLLDEWDEASLFEPMEGRQMREYVVLPEGLYQDAAALGSWILRSFDYASSLPAGAAKKEAKSRGGRA